MTGFTTFCTSGVAHLPQPCCDFYMIGDMVPFKDIYPYLNILILPVPSQHRAKDTILTTYQQQWEGLTWEKVEVLWMSSLLIVFCAGSYTTGHQGATLTCHFPESRGPVRLDYWVKIPDDLSSPWAQVRGERFQVNTQIC